MNYKCLRSLVGVPSARSENCQRNAEGRTAINPLIRSKEPNEKQR